MKILVWLVVNTLALAAAAWLLDGIRVDGATTSDEALNLVLVAVVFGLVNAVVAPVVKFLALPFIILTIGLLLLVINGAMLVLTDRIAEAVGIGFHVDGFGTAVLGAIVVTVATWLLEAVLPDPDRAAAGR